MKNNFFDSNKLNFKFDFNSVKFRIWVYFTLFAVFLLAAIWCLQYMLMDTNYAKTKQKEAGKIQSELKRAYTSGYSIFGEDGAVHGLRIAIKRCSEKYDAMILVQDPETDTIEYSSDGAAEWINQHPGSKAARYGSLMSKLEDKLENSSMDSARLISEKNKTVGIVQILSLKSMSGVSYSSGKYYLYVFAPLAPVGTTMAILRKQIFTICIIAMLLSLVVAIYLSSRISRPINKITNSAARLGKGDYDVKFEANSFSEINELASTLSKAEGEMKRIDLYQKDLIANVSHDLRTPLTMIRSYAEMIRDISGDNPKKRNDHLNVIIEESDRLNGLVTDMLTLSRAQAHRLALEETDFQLEDAASALLDTYRLLNESDGYHIKYNDNRGSYPVHGDEVKLQQVMTNLIGNAVKYCGEDKYILIELKKIGRRVRFSVTDHGNGIAPDEITHVWDRYYKSSTNHVRSTTGTGLGLSICKEILNLHGASYDVKSREGKGSTFWFELPLSEKKK